MTRPLISIIVPVYKVEKYLDKCIESIVNQTYSNIEIILVDDGSPDNCPEMCDAWAKKDNRISVIHKENDGLANARNDGVKLSQGSYIAFVDSDDLIDPDMIQFLYELIIQGDYDVSRCGVTLEYDDTSKNRSYSCDYKIIPSKNQLIIDLVDDSYNGGITCNKLYKSSVIKSIAFHKEDGASEDILFNYRVYTKTDKAIFYDVPKYHYVIRENSITNSSFGEGAFSIIRAKRLIMNDNVGNKKVRQYCIRGFVRSSFIVLSGVITNNACLDKYDKLRKDILRYKWNIMFSKKYSFRDKIRTIVLALSPRLYNRIVLKNK